MKIAEKPVTVVKKDIIWQEYDIVLDGNSFRIYCRMRDGSWASMLMYGNLDAKPMNDERMTNLYTLGRVIYIGRYMDLYDDGLSERERFLREINA